MQNCQRLLRYGFVGVFAVLLTLPLVTQLSPVLRLDSNILQENRAVTTLSMPQDMADLRAFPAGVQNWISDNFGLRKMLIYINNNMVFGLFGDIPRFRKQVVLGTGGYIFLSSHELPMDQMLDAVGIIHKKSLNAERMESMPERVCGLSDRLVFVSVPTKHLLYTELYPTWLRDKAVPARDVYVADMLALQQRAEGKLLFPYKEAKELGVDHQLIAKTFFHWVSGPYTQLVAGLVAQHFGIAPLEGSPFTDFVTTRQVSDIQHMYPGLSIFETDVEQYPTAYFDQKGIRMEKFAQPSFTLSSKIEKIMASSYVLVNPARPSKDRLLVIGDSFAWPAMYDFSLLFGEVLHVNNNELRQLSPEQANDYVKLVLQHFKPTHGMLLSHIGYLDVHADLISDYLKETQNK